MADRYTYLPLTGLFVAAIWGVADLLGTARRGRLALGAAGGAAMVAAAALTWGQLGYWKDSFTLYRHALAVTGDNPLMVNNYGAALDEAGRHEEAIRVLEAGLAAGAASGSTLQFMLLNSYASALNAAGRPAEAMGALERAIADRPTHAKSYYDLARILHVTYGDVEAASSLYERAIGIDPGYVDAYVNLGGALNRSGRFERGLEVLQRARALAQTDRAELRFNLGVSYAALGDTSAAMQEAEALRRLDPGMAQRLAAYVAERAASAPR
jgi:tetratricopeptide (TPR) repeat protein